MAIKAVLKDAFSLKDDTADHDEIRDRLIEGGQVTGSNMGILMLAILIASIGLNMNSTAVIIGAMLISPLMGSIQAAAYGIASSDLQLIRKSFLGLGFQVAVSLLTSTIYFKLSPISTATSELLARTQPTIWDVLIALCGGLAGIIGITRTEKSNVIPGVAIATALMPPLCTCGYGIATAQWSFLFGVGYLFCVNAYFILFASTLILAVLNVPKKFKTTLNDEQRKALRNKIVVNTLIVIIPSLFVAYDMVQNADSNKEAILGFRNDKMNVETFTEEAQILYPQIDALRLKRIEAVSVAGAESALELEISVGEPLNKEEAGRLEEWAESIYDEDISLIQRQSE